MFSPSLEHAAYDVQVVKDCQEDQQLVENRIHLSLKNKFKLERKTKIKRQDTQKHIFPRQVQILNGARGANGIMG